jgi:ADP-heptose:LPS heptosyltransferase
VIQQFPGAYLAIGSSIKENMRNVFKKVTLFSGFIEYDDSSKDSFLSLCRDRGLTPAKFDVENYLPVQYTPLKKWFKIDSEPTIPPGRYVGFQVTSSTGGGRPPIPHLEKFLNIAICGDCKPVFFGTAQDGIRFEKNYPGVLKKYRFTSPQIRFGEDSFDQTIANLARCRGVIGFSSCLSIVAALHGRPTFELWRSQVLLRFAKYVQYSLGAPIHLTQADYRYEPWNADFLEAFVVNGRSLRLDFHGF